MQKKSIDTHDYQDAKIESVDDTRFIRNKMIELAAENTKLNDEVDRLTYLLSRKSFNEQYGRINLNVNLILEILNFEKYIAHEDTVCLVHHNNNFIRIVPAYDISTQPVEVRQKIINQIEQQKDHEKKQNITTKSEYDSIYYEDQHS